MIPQTPPTSDVLIFWEMWTDIRALTQYSNSNIVLAKEWRSVLDVTNMNINYYL